MKLTRPRFFSFNQNTRNRNNKCNNPPNPKGVPLPVTVRFNERRHARGVPSHAPTQPINREHSPLGWAANPLKISIVRSQRVSRFHESNAGPDVISDSRFTPLPKTTHRDQRPHTPCRHARSTSMRIAFFSTKDYDKASFTAANERLPEGQRCVC